MIFVDTSIWIDYFNGRATPQTDFLDKQFGSVEVVTGDLVLFEVLQGCRDDRHAASFLQRLEPASIIQVAGEDIAIAAAIAYRRLRSLGITVRRTIDSLIATRCILDDIPLLREDRDFDGFVRHLGLRDAMLEPL